MSLSFFNPIYIGLDDSDPRLVLINTIQRMIGFHKHLLFVQMALIFFRYITAMIHEMKAPAIINQ